MIPVHNIHCTENTFAKRNSPKDKNHHGIISEYTNIFINYSKSKQDTNNRFLSINSRCNNSGWIFAILKANNNNVDENFNIQYLTFSRIYQLK